MSRTTTSIRLDDGLKEQLDEIASLEGTTVTALIERFVSEGLKMKRHPGIIFNNGPSGRRATLIAGPDVWEVASSLRHTSGTERERIQDLSAQFELRDEDIVAAILYMTDYPEEIEARVQANDRGLDHAERQYEERKKLFA